MWKHFDLRAVTEENRRGVGEKVGGEIKSLTDGCSQTKAGGVVTSAGRAGVGLVSLASSGLSYMPDPSRAGPLRGT